MQTPQAFLAPKLREAYAGDLAGATDCSSLVEACGGRVKVVEGDPRLLKVTTPRRSRAGRGVAVKAVVFDVGETLVDETGMWERAADAAGVPRFTLMGVLGGLAARGEHHNDVWEILGVEHPASTWEPERLLSRCAALPRSAPLSWASSSARQATCPLATRSCCASTSTSLGSSGRWGVEKPAPEFFERIVAASGFAADEIAYVGDRVDNDVVPALAPGWSPSTSGAAPGATCTTRRPRAIRDPTRSPSSRRLLELV